MQRKVPYEYLPNANGGQIKGDQTAMEKRLQEVVAELKRDHALAERMIKTGRGTDEERARVEAGRAKVEEGRAIIAKLKSIKEDEELLDQFKGYTTGGHPADSVNDPELKHRFAHAMQYKQPTAWNTNLRTKDGFMVGNLIPASGSQVVNPSPGVAATALRDLLASAQTATGAIRYYQIGGGETAEIVAEGALKPDLGASVTGHNVELKKIATTFQYTDEFKDDAGFILQYIQAEALRSILRRENQLIIDTINATSGIVTKNGDRAEIIDVMAEVIAAAESLNGITPTKIVANPADVAAIRTAKAVGSGGYFVDPLTKSPASVHGVPILSTPAVPAGTIYAITDGAGVFYTHNTGLRIETGFAGDDFMHNRMTVRVEERVLPAIVRPNLITKITLTE